MLRPNISVYMAAYNAERWIERAIRSCLAQTLPPMEVVVVDDASTDGTAAVVRSIEDPRVRLVVLETNGGPGPARNRALEIARGDWLAMMDSDDEMFPTRLEVLARCVERDSSLRILTDLMLREQRGRWVHLDDGTSRLPDVEILHPADILRRNLGAKPYFFAGLLQETGVRYPAIRAAQDTSFLVQLSALSGFPIAQVQVRLYGYRDVPGSLSKRSESMFSERLRMLADLERRFPTATDLRSAIESSRSIFLDDRTMYRLKGAVRTRSPRTIIEALGSKATLRVLARRLAQKSRRSARAAWSFSVERMRWVRLSRGVGER